MTDDSNPPVPTRDERKKCHAGRDKYYACLEEHKIMDPAKAGDLCQDAKRAMAADCPEVWATYFEQLFAQKKMVELRYRDMPRPSK